MQSDFFGELPNREELESHANDSDTTLRWSAAVELAEVGEIWALLILWKLRDDEDEYVRLVAERGLASAPRELQLELATELNQEFAARLEGPLGSIQGTGDGLAPFHPWKTRPLDPPSPENDWAVGSAVTDIVQTEGPITGARLIRLYGESAFRDSPKRINRYRVQKAVEALISRARLARLDSSGSSDLMDWTLAIYGVSGVVPRERGARRVSEIPPVEVSAALEKSLGLRARRLNNDRRFQEILGLYEIQPNEYHLVGAALEKEWRELLA